MAKNKTDLPGFEFTAGVMVPEGFEEGKWHFTQIFHSTKNIWEGKKLKEKAEITITITKTNKKGEILLDTNLIYENRIFPTGKAPQVEDDSPHIWLGVPLFSKELVPFSVDNFRVLDTWVQRTYGNECDSNVGLFSQGGGCPLKNHGNFKESPSANIWKTAPCFRYLMLTGRSQL